MSQNYTFLDWITLEPGSWADWFAGTMSFAAIATALAGYAISDWQRKTDEQSKDRAAVELATYKLIQVLNHTASIARHLKTSLEQKGVASQFHFARVRPLGIGTPVLGGFASNEINALLKARAEDILMDGSSCIERYASIHYAMQEYKIRHEALFELMPSPSSLNDMIFDHQLTREQHTKILPYARMLDSLLFNTIALVQENLLATEQVLKLVRPAMTKHFGKWHLEYVGQIDEVSLASHVPQELKN